MTTHRIRRFRFLPPRRLHLHPSPGHSLPAVPQPLSQRTTAVRVKKVHDLLAETTRIAEDPAALATIASPTRKATQLLAQLADPATVPVEHVEDATEAMIATRPLALSTLKRR